MKTEDTITILALEQLSTVNGGFGPRARFVANHPVRAARFFANHPQAEARFAANHPGMGARIDRIQCRRGW